MKCEIYRRTVILTFAMSVALLGFGVANAQTANPYGGGYSTGYGTVYGSFGQAMATQNIYNTMQAQMRKTMMRNAMIKKWGLAAVEKAERESGSTSSSGTKAKASAASPKIVVPPPPVVRNYGVFRPDNTVDTGKALADALGETPEEKALIKQIYVATKAAYQKEVSDKGWRNNIAAGLTFFTVASMTVYHDSAEPSDEAVTNYFKIVSTSLDEIPEFGKIANKDKQAYNNMLVGFSGLLLAGYAEGKQNNDAATIAAYKKLAGNMIQMVLKTDPENIRLENDQIVVKL